jgi:allophanate hydrolase subunit 1
MALGAEFRTTQVSTAGTRVQISNTSRRVQRVSVKPHRDVVAGTYFGMSDVSSTVGWSMSTNQPPETFDFSSTIKPVYQRDFYVDADFNGDRVDTIWVLV